MCEPYVAGVEGDAAVWIGAGCAIFKVTLNYASNGRELRPYLVVSSGVQFHLQQEISLCGFQKCIFQASLLGPVFWDEACVGLVLLLVAGEVMGEHLLILFWTVAYNSPICFVHLAGAEGLIQAAKSL